MRQDTQEINLEMTQRLELANKNFKEALIITSNEIIFLNYKRTSVHCRISL